MPSSACTEKSSRGSYNTDAGNSSKEGWIFHALDSLLSALDAMHAMLAVVPIYAA